MKELNLMEDVVVLWLNDILTIEERDRFLKVLQERLDRELKKQEKE